MKNNIHLTLLLIALSFGSSCKALDEVIDINQLAFGGCVPLDIYDAVELLKRVVDQSIIQDFKDSDINVIGNYHMSLGVTLRGTWRLWDRENSRLGNWFNNQDYAHPDTMSGFIMKALWKDLHGEPINMEILVLEYEIYKKDFAQKVEIIPMYPDKISYSEIVRIENNNLSLEPCIHDI